MLNFYVRVFLIFSLNLPGKIISVFSAFTFKEAQLFDYLYFLVFKMKSKLLVTKQTSADFQRKQTKSQ